MPIPVEVSYSGVKVEFDLEDVIGKLSGLFNKDKRRVCLLLDCYKLFLKIWFNDIIHNFAPIRSEVKYDDLKDEDKVKLDEFLGQTKYVPIAQMLAKYFDNMKDEYKRDKGIIKNKVDFDMIEKFLEDILYFERFGRTESEWYPLLNKEGLNLELYEDWRKGMQEIVNRNTPELMDIKTHLNCREDDMLDLIQGL